MQDQAGPEWTTRKGFLMSTDSMTHTTTDPTGWSATEEELDAEQALLGAMMQPISVTGRDGSLGAMNSPAISDATRVLRPEMLFRHAHQAIMSAILGLEESGVKGIEPLTVADELGRRGELVKVGGAPYLLELVQRNGLPSSASFYAHVIFNGYRRRSAITLSRTVAQAAATRTTSDDIDETVETAYRVYTEETVGARTNDLVSASDSSDLIDDILREWGTPSIGSMTTGLVELDSVLDVEKGALVTVGADSGVGKSIICAQIARHYVFDRGEPAIFFSMEMSRRELYQRDLAAMARVRLDSATGKTVPGEYEFGKLREAAKRYKIEGGLMFHDDTKGVDLSHIRARMSQVRREHDHIGVVCVDYLGLMDLPRRDREDQALGDATKALKQLAGEFECIVVVASQLNGEAQARPDGRPKANDLRGSKRVWHDSDVVLLLHDVAQFGKQADSDEHPRAGEIDIVLDKQRKGRSHAVVTVEDRRAFAEFGNF